MRHPSARGDLLKPEPNKAGPTTGLAAVRSESGPYRRCRATGLQLHFKRRQSD